MFLIETKDGWTLLLKYIFVTNINLIFGYSYRWMGNRVQNILHKFGNLTRYPCLTPKALRFAF